MPSWSSTLSLYSIPVVWFTSFYPQTMKFLIIKNTAGFNNVQPRSNVSKFVENKNISPKLAARVERMEGAHLNGNEALPLWFAAVLAGNYAGLSNEILNSVSLSYIVTRLAYNYVYINQETPGKSWLRTSLFFFSLSMPMTLLIKAANKMVAQ
ncbi:hypothetical protein BDQ12DRAFT_692667 [Crucibulum laeve]|uniref:Membrane-associated, eicosanoid/glutathione metabolism protein n=1 Tax=Crucibulum laeve TaxID=68775 RepID=A0A5C3LI89_9AGAR|nr:hypothetical protein BDQ12DRAFT_692667 [Crucibulum laeve]